MFIKGKRAPATVFHLPGADGKTRRFVAWRDYATA